jgi:hypothetical protein
LGTTSEQVEHFARSENAFSIPAELGVGGTALEGGVGFPVGFGLALGLGTVAARPLFLGLGAVAAVPVDDGLDGARRRVGSVPRPEGAKVGEASFAVAGSRRSKRVSSAQAAWADLGRSVRSNRSIRSTRSASPGGTCGLRERRVGTLFSFNR